MIKNYKQIVKKIIRKISREPSFLAYEMNLLIFRNTLSP